MNETKPTVAMIKEEATGRWKIELRDLRSFREIVGPDVVNGFCRCFVHADRLTSLMSFGYLSLKHHGESTPGFSRNLQTLAWFAVGTLHELALALRALRSTLAKRALLDSNSKPWITLRQVEERWEEDPFFRDMRNIAAFHVDAEVMEKGLTTLQEEGNVILCEGLGDKLDEASMRLGLEALLNGSGRTLTEFDRLMKTLSEDHGISSTIHDAFILVLEARGVMVENMKGKA
jgi:hypothetical protein